MARHVRIRVSGGWYHVFTRGHNRGSLFCLKGEPWSAFRDRYGDWGRDLVLWAGRRYCGMRLAELSEKAGGIGNSAVTLAVQRLQEKARRQRGLNRALRTVAKQNCEDTSPIPATDYQSRDRGTRRMRKGA